MESSDRALLPATATNAASPPEPVRDDDGAEEMPNADGEQGAAPSAEPGANPDAHADANPDARADANPDANLRAGLSYLPPVGLYLFFTENHDARVRFDAAQSLVLTLCAATLLVARWLIFGALDRVASLAMVFVEVWLACAFGLVAVVLAGLWLWAMLAAFTGRSTRLPLAGQLAERLASSSLGRAS